MTEEVADQSKGETFKFVVTIEGNQNDWAKFTTETFLVAADGSTKEAGPKLSKDVENVLTALLDAGEVLRTLSLTTGVALAIKSGDLATALGLARTARDLGISLTSLADLVEPAVAV